MRKLLLLFTISIISIVGFSQDFSNKGKDFWVGYGYHQVMTNGGNAQDMVLYFATDQVSNVTVSIPLLGYTVTYNNIAANTVFQTPPLPKGGVSDARLFAEGLSDKGIHITSDVPIVAYAHIYNASVSGATVLYPVPTLGKSYYSVNFTNNSNTTNANCWFYVVAVDTGTTVVSITPSANTTGGWVAGTKNNVTLTQGQIYNVMGITSGNNGVDLTGSIIESIASGTSGCKRIAVFSGSGRIAIACNGAAPSSDNYMVQGLPKSAWGKNFLTVPSANYTSTAGVAAPMGNMYRICVTDPSTIVTVDGLPIAVPLNGGFYYELTQSANLRKIVADKPIMVAQYFPSQGNAACGIPSGDGDPEVIYLSPIEQSINEVRWDACANFAIKAQKHYINVVIPNGGTAISSLLLDGAPLPAGTFTVHPQDPAYSYAIIRVGGQTGASVPHLIQSDSGFNAIAYGYGATESYGYNAGTNVKDLNTSLEISTTGSIETTPTTCVGNLFGFKVYLPNKSTGPTPVEIRYDSIRWSCSNAGAMNPNNFPVTIYGTPTIIPDSVNIRNGKEVAWYSIPGLYSFTAAGVYQITITVYRTSTEGCGNEQDYTFNLTVNDPPTGSFSASLPGCYLDPVNFTETTLQIPKATYAWSWTFGDPTSGAANTSNQKNPSHTFSGPGTYTVQYTGTTTSGCIATAQQTIIIPDIPNGTINGTTTVCINSAPLPSVTLTGSGGVAPYLMNYSINGVAQPQVTSNALGVFTITNIPTNVAGTFIYSLDSIKNLTATICKRIITGQAATVTVSSNATITYQAGSINQTVCINAPIQQIDYLVGSGGTGATFTPAVPGLTGTYNAGTKIYSITGSPTVAGTYTVTVKPTGPCVDPAVSLSFTLTVNATATLSLLSGNANPTLCINSNGLVITPIVYSIGGGATGATVTGLPPGVTGTYNAATQQFTITGIPTVTVLPFTYTYSVSTVSTCINPPPLGGTITVNPDATIALTSAPATTNQTKCVNNNITPITYAIDGSVTSVNVLGLPPGVTFVYTPGTPGNPGVLTISGAPTTNVGSPFNYSVVLAGPCQVPAVQTGIINVNPDAGINLLSATGSPTACVNNPISIVYQVTGSVTAANLTGTLPPGVTYTYVPGNPGSITISGTPTSSVGSPFNYSITLTGPCLVPPAKTGAITVTPDATVSLNAGSIKNQTVCVNTAITPILFTIGGSATGATITSLPPGVTSTVAGNTVTIQGTPTVVSTAPVVYTYHVKTTGPCVNPDSTGTITVNPDHTLTLNAGSSEIQTVCSGIPIAPIVYTFNGGATGVSVTTLPPGLAVTTVGNTVTITGTPTASGSYTIKTIGNACVFVQRGGTINVVPLPTANFNWTAPSCNTRVIGFTDNSVPNSGTLSNWSWNFADPASGPNNTSGLQNPAHTFSLPGTYNVTLTVTTTPNGCFNSTPFMLPVVINERPKTDFTVPTTACVSDIAQFTDASVFTLGTGTFNVNAYKWDFGDPASGASNTQTAMNGTHQFSAGGTYTVTHISQSTAGCADTITHTVNIASAPVANFSVTNSGALCVNDTVSIVNLSTIGVGNISKLEIYWDFVGAPGTFVVDNAPVLNTVYKHKYPNFQAPVTKPYTVVVRAYSGVSCVNEKQTVITLNAVPKVQFNAMPDACYDAAPFQITQASEVGGVPGNGVYTGPGVSPTGLFSPATAGVGTHTIKYTFTSVAGCVDTMSNTIKVLDTASAKFSYVTPVCDGSAITFKEESTAPAGVTLNNTTWNFGDGSAVEQHLPGTTFTHTFPTWGSYNVTMFNTSAVGCKSTSTVTALRVNPIPQAVFSFNQTTLCIPNAAVTMTNTSIADNSSITYAWDFGDPASGPLNTASVKTPPPHLYSGTGPYTVTLTVNGAVGTNGYCQQTITHVVDFIHPQPKTAFSFNKPEVCIGGDVLVTDNTTTTDGSTIVKWYWDFGDGITGNVWQLPHTYNAPNTYNVSLYTTNSFNCSSDTLTQLFRVDPYPTVDAGPDRVVLEGGSVTMQPVVTGNDLQYLWSPATYLTSTTDATPTANIILTDITYTLTVTGRGGCTAPSDNVFIKVLKAPRIPNTFTPNGDGINETWLIDYLDTYPNCRVQVFTRTGQLVFESRGYKTPWNGTLNGKPLPFDTYYYIVEPGNGRPPMTGYVTIVK